MHQNSHYRDSRRRREREKGPEKIFGEIIEEKLPNMGKDIANQVQKCREPQAG